jgi:hypothetical protein
MERREFVEKRTLALAYLAVLVVSGGLSLGCESPGDTKPSPSPTPAVLAVKELSPASGPIYGPTTVTILGSGFDSHAIVIFDGGPVTTIQTGSTAISFNAPAHAAGPVTVLVANGDGNTVTAPPFTYRAAPLQVFTDAATGFATSDLRDAQDQIVRVDRDGFLIWTEDGTALKGFGVLSGIYIPAAHVCECEFEVRFGTEDGERRAYLTADWGHDNPGTVVDLAVTGGTLIVRRSDRYPPGSYTLSGIVSEATPAGNVPVAGIPVYFGTRTGWLAAVTDPNGFYQFRGLYNGGETLQINSPGHQALQTRVSINGDTRFDVQLVRR